MGGMRLGTSSAMATRPEELDRIAEALRDTDAVDASGIELRDEGGAVVLRGAVPSFEEATLAAAIAEQHGGTMAVRNELRVDPNLREDPSPGLSATYERGGGEEVRASSYEGSFDEGDDLVTDVGDALAENVPWDPPDQPTEAPTLAEERGVVDHDVTALEPAAAGPLSEDEAEGVEPSLPDLSPEDLRRAAHPEPRRGADRGRRHRTQASDRRA